MQKRKSTAGVYLNKNKALMLVICVVFSLGVYMGVLAGRGSDLSALDVSGIYASGATISEVVMVSFCKNIKLVAWICIAAMSVIGLPAILYMIYSKGMAVGCTVYALFLLSERGTAHIVLCCTPYILCLILSFVITGCEGISFSAGVARKIFTKAGARIDLSEKTVPFALAVLFSCVCVFGAAFCELIIKANI